jgi:hypothetical protein
MLPSPESSGLRSSLFRLENGQQSITLKTFQEIMDPPNCFWSDILPAHEYSGLSGRARQGASLRAPRRPLPGGPDAMPLHQR